jgi:hypothetical protein
MAPSPPRTHPRNPPGAIRLRTCRIKMASHLTIRARKEPTRVTRRIGPRPEPAIRCATAAVPTRERLKTAAIRSNGQERLGDLA